MKINNDEMLSNCVAEECTQRLPFCKRNRRGLYSHQGAPYRHLAKAIQRMEMCCETNPCPLDFL